MGDGYLKDVDDDDGDDDDKRQPGNNGFKEVGRRQTISQIP